MSKSKIPAQSAADINQRERDLERLGLAVRVRYLGPTNSKGGRYVAEVCGDSEPCRTFVNSQLHNRCESTRLAAAETCLARWNENRRQWWVANLGKDYRPLSLYAVGHDGKAWLFFASSN